MVMLSPADEAQDVADYPAPVAGLVIRYSYLGKREADLGQVEGTKHRPCVVVVCVQQVDEELVVTVAPITHTEPPDPDQAIGLTSAMRLRGARQEDSRCGRSGHGESGRLVGSIVQTGGCGTLRPTCVSTKEHKPS
jgi:hypothetical protein